MASMKRYILRNMAEREFGKRLTPKRLRKELAKFSSISWTKKGR
jgi:hypothetical protein